MTNHVATLVILLPLFLVSTAFAFPPVELENNYLLLGADRLEFADNERASQGADAIHYTYSITDDLNASLVLNYDGSGRRREVSLRFLPDGSPDGYQEFDFASTSPPMPPMFRSGNFEIGELDVPPPPPVVSSAPDDLTGRFIQAGGQRFEYLTDASGRRYRPGACETFNYTYSILDELSAKIAMTFTEGGYLSELILTFDSDGNPDVYKLTRFENGNAVAEQTGNFEIGGNRHLGDLKIGKDADHLVGNDYFGAIGHRQTAERRVTAIEPVNFHFAIENDGDTDRFRLSASKGNRQFSVEYFSYPGHENLTAALISGRYETSELSHGVESAYNMTVTPTRKNGTFVGNVSARSLTVEGAHDHVHSTTRVKELSRGREKHERENRKRGKNRGKK